jgi:hypothetical protein
VRADLFGIVGLAADAAEPVVGDVLPAREFRAGVVPADGGIRTVGGEEQRAVEPPHTEAWSHLGTGVFDVFAPDLPGGAMQVADRAPPAPVLAAPAPPVLTPRSPTLPAVGRDTNALPLLIGLLGVGALLALRESRATGRKKVVRSSRALLRVAARVMAQACPHV